MGTAFWVIGGLMLIGLTVLAGDKATRRQVVRAIGRRWEKRQRRSERTRARQHVRATRAAINGGAGRMQQARPRFERPKQPRLGAKKCSAACRTSRKPAFHPKTGALLCDCPCGGREHGVYRKGSTTTPKTRKGASVGSSGTKRVTAPASSTTPARVPTSTRPARQATTGTLTPPKPRPTGVPVRTVSPTAPPAQQKWNSLQVSSWESMRRHVDQSPRCARGTFSAETIRDRRTDPPKVSQSIKCDTCGSAVR